MGILALLVFILFAFLIFKGSQQNNILGNHHQLLDQMHLSSQEFYLLVEQLVHDKQLRDVSLLRITYAQGGIFSARREYLRVRYKNYFFDVCAAPFATNFFVSWWFAEAGTPLRDLFQRIPIVGMFMTKRAKTFYEMDTENMMKEMIMQCVNIAISQMKEAKGVRSSSIINV